ncbi:MAG TPA: rod shape-determining protein MreC [Ilumatobacteraceae bacterium]|nr:rod shape-determining protein MreC [Ilumatobacteraceae bacterium]
MWAYPHVAAVVTSDLSAATDRLTIDKGSLVGIRVGMPVLNQKGLVGRITSVEPTQSEVLLVSSEDYAVTARTGSVSGALEGKGAGLQLFMRVLTDSGSPVVGDVVETAGGSVSLAPSGIPIGVVVSVGHATGSSMSTAEVEWINAGSLSGTVTVLLYQPSDADGTAPVG